jgi:phosphatidate cytidylyltransferase
LVAFYKPDLRLVCRIATLPPVITRIIVGLIALPLVLIPIWLGGVWCVALLLLVGLAGGDELYGMMEKGGYRPNRWLGLAWLGSLVLNGWQPHLFPLPLLLSGGLVLAIITALWQPDHPIHTWASTSIGAIYLGTILGQALALRFLSEGLWWLLFGLILTWINDTAAYFTGVTLGRRKLWPRLSPKKSWEGTIGGWIGAALCGGLLGMWLPLPINMQTGALIGLIAGILALFGDLSISMIKRQIGVKDTGRLFPGHGGMLDRLDSVLFVLPFVYQVALRLAAL